MMAWNKAGASAHNIKPWDARRWSGAWRVVKRLQMRIAKELLVKRLNAIFTHSNHATILAVNRGLFGSTNRNEKNKCGAKPRVKWYIMCYSGLQNHQVAILGNRNKMCNRKPKRIIINPGSSTRLALTNARAV